MIDRTGIADALIASTSRTAPAMRENLNGFVGVCAEFAPLEGNANLKTFLDFLDVAETSEDPIPLAATASTDSVKLMTVHGAKGLEFDTVFLPVLAASQEVNHYDGNRKASVFPDVRASSPPLSSTERAAAGCPHATATFLPQYKGNKSSVPHASSRRGPRKTSAGCSTSRSPARSSGCTAPPRTGTASTRRRVRRLPRRGARARRTSSSCSATIPPSDDEPGARRDAADLVWPLASRATTTQRWTWIATVDAMRSGTHRSARTSSSGEARAILAEHLRVIDALDRARPTKCRRPIATTARRSRRRPPSGSPAGTEALDAILNPLPQRPTAGATTRRRGPRVDRRTASWAHRSRRGGRDRRGVAPPGSIHRRAAQGELHAIGFEERVPFALPGGEPATEVPFTLKIGGRHRHPGTHRRCVTRDGRRRRSRSSTSRRAPSPRDPDWGQLELYAEALAALGILDGEATLTFAFLKTGEPKTKRYTPRGLSWIAEGLARAAS